MCVCERNKSLNNNNNRISIEKITYISIVTLSCIEVEDEKREQDIVRMQNHQHTERPSQVTTYVWVRVVIIIIIQIRPKKKRSRICSSMIRYGKKEVGGV